jgi:hypothetical protein
MIVAQHDGHIWAENSDAGPVFSFVLPLKGLDSTRAEPMVEETPVIHEGLRRYQYDAR